MKIPIIGATGLVGNVMLEVLSERGLSYDELILVASERSVGKVVRFGDKQYTIHSLEQALEQKPDLALFSAGGETSLAWAPKFAAVGTRVIDNSSAWRMDESKKLIVPEVNGSDLNTDDWCCAWPQD